MMSKIAGTKPKELLAVSFNDLDGNHQFDKTDTLIASLADTNKDGVVSIGDTVQFGQYPLHTDGTGVGTFTQTTAPVTDVIFSGPGQVQVLSGTSQVWWQDTPAQDYFFAGDTHTSSIVNMVDNTQAGTSDQVLVNLGGIGLPDTQVNDTVFEQLPDNGFLDVFIV